MVFGDDMKYYKVIDPLMSRESCVFKSDGSFIYQYAYNRWNHMTGFTFETFSNQFKMVEIKEEDVFLEMI